MRTVQCKCDCSVFWTDKNKNCSVWNKNLDINNHKKDRTVCKDCYNKKKRKNNLTQKENTTSHQQPKFENGNNNKNNRTLLVFQVKHILS